jgi:hypothetical protein
MWLANSCIYSSETGAARVGFFHLICNFVSTAMSVTRLARDSMRRWKISAAESVAFEQRRKREQIRLLGIIELRRSYTSFYVSLGRDFDRTTWRDS